MYEAFINRFPTFISLVRILKNRLERPIEILRVTLNAAPGFLVPVAFYTSLEVLNQFIKGAGVPLDLYSLSLQFSNLPEQLCNPLKEQSSPKLGLLAVINLHSSGAAQNNVGYWVQGFFYN